MHHADESRSSLGQTEVRGWWVIVLVLVAVVSAAYLASQHWTVRNPETGEVVVMAQWLYKTPAEEKREILASGGDAERLEQWRADHESRIVLIGSGESYALPPGYTYQPREIPSFPADPAKVTRAGRVVTNGNSNQVELRVYRE